MPSATTLLSLLSLSAVSLASPQRGLCYSNATLASYFSSYSSVTWGYNWGYPSNGLLSKWEYIPMLWGNPTGNPSYGQSWQAAVQTAMTSGTTHLLGFNEPDINNLSPSDAAAAYQNYMQPYAGKIKIGAPAVTNGGPPTGLTWLEEFLGNCTSCTIDFVPIHWYANWNQPDYFASYVQQAHAAGGNRPLWITEFEGEGSADQQVSFIQTVLPWLDAQNFVERYSYFGVFSNLLIDANSDALSTIGQAFAGTSGVNGTTPTSNV